MMIQAQVLVDRFLRNKVSHQYKLNAYEKLVLFFLASYMGAKSECYPSIPSLAIDCSISVDTVKRSIQSLEKDNQLIQVNRSPGRNNHYSFTSLIINQASANSTQCSQHLDANSTANHVLIAPTPDAISTPNNIINNIKECTSLKIGEVKTSPCSVSEGDQFAGNDIQEIFKYWQDAMNHPRAKLDSKRRGKIIQALKNYTIIELKQAIDGCSKTPHNMGDNDRHQFYDDIELILRDASHIERFMAHAINPPTANGKSSGATTDIMVGVGHE